ncbi:MAG: protein phosphatase 2C domain-containing protein [Zetaproteobacteria bacterium]|nr:protein phosphatase 2C domain-containing protein [Zetaproteobacteria bacterium]
MGTYHINARGITDIGRVRSTNQDSILLNDNIKIYSVADGMGGHAGGEVASRICVETLEEYFMQYPSSEGGSDYEVWSAHFSRAINQASMNIYKQALMDPSLVGMGTTATAVRLCGKSIVYGHVGDSRLYLIRKNFVFQLTSDHSLVGEQLEAGILTKEEARGHQLRNVITRCVGFQEEELVDTGFVDMEPGDYFFITSDGLHGKVEDAEIGKEIRDRGLDALAHLVQVANERGGEDNISAILLEVEG